MSKIKHALTRFDVCAMLILGYLAGNLFETPVGLVLLVIVGLALMDGL